MLKDSQSRRVWIAASISRCKLTLLWQFMSCTYFQVLFEISLLPLKAPQWTYSNLSKSAPVLLFPCWKILSQEKGWAASISLRNQNKNTSSCQNLSRNWKCEYANNSLISPLSRFSVKKSSQYFTLQTDFVVTIYVLYILSSPDGKVNLLPHKSQQNPVSSLIQNFAN